jgi:hypothetical protein
MFIYVGKGMGCDPFLVPDASKVIMEALLS